MNSYRDAEGRLCIDCTECAYGWNGDKSCDRAWEVSKPKVFGCREGELLPGIPGKPGQRVPPAMK